MSLGYNELLEQMVWCKNILGLTEAEKGAECFTKEILLLLNDLLMERLRVKIKMIFMMPEY